MSALPLDVTPTPPACRVWPRCRASPAPSSPSVWSSPSRHWSSPRWRGRSGFDPAPGHHHVAAGAPVTCCFRSVSIRTAASRPPAGCQGDTETEWVRQTHRPGGIRRSWRRNGCDKRTAQAASDGRAPVLSRESAVDRAALGHISRHLVGQLTSTQAIPQPNAPCSQCALTNSAWTRQGAPGITSPAASPSPGVAGTPSAARTGRARRPRVERGCNP